MQKRRTDSRQTDEREREREREEEEEPLLPLELHSLGESVGFNI